MIRSMHRLTTQCMSSRLIWLGLGILCNCIFCSAILLSAFKSFFLHFLPSYWKFSRKFEKWSCEWCKSADKYWLHLDTFLKTSHDKNNKKIQTLSKIMHLGWLFAQYIQYFSLFAENLSLMHKICIFAQNLSFCSYKSPFLPFELHIFPCLIYSRPKIGDTISLS